MMLFMMLLRIFPDYLRIGTNAPDERVPPARLHFHKNRGARVIRNNIKIQIPATANIAYFDL
jgi:hypothetical protein